MRAAMCGASNATALARLAPHAKPLLPLVPSSHEGVRLPKIQRRETWRLGMVFMVSRGN